MRCQRCGATNPADARWCGQCYAAFADPASGPPSGAPQSAATPEETTTATDEMTAAERTGGGQDAVSVEVGTAGVPGRADRPGEAGRAGIRQRGDVLEWECVMCGEFNPLADTACQVCGTSFAARFAQPESQAEPSSWGAAFALSAILPGTGHYLAGRLGTGVARALLYVVWLVGGLVLLLTAGSIAALAAVPLLLGALVVWAGTLLDLASVRRGEREVLTGRALLWLVVGVTALLLLGAFGGAARLT